MNKNYTKLHELSKKNTILASIQNLLEWDQETYMPHDAITSRSAQIEAMAILLHKAKTGTSFAKQLATLIDLESGKILDETLNASQKAALREWRCDYHKSVLLPASFVKTFASVTSAAIHQWGKAKENNKFSDFSPHLTKIVALSRKKSRLFRVF